MIDVPAFGAGRIDYGEGFAIYPRGAGLKFSGTIRGSVGTTFFLIVCCPSVAGFAFPLTVDNKPSCCILTMLLAVGFVPSAASFETPLAVGLVPLFISFAFPHTATSNTSSRGISLADVTTLTRLPSKVLLQPPLQSLLPRNNLHRSISHSKSTSHLSIQAQKFKHSKPGQELDFTLRGSESW